MKENKELREKDIAKVKRFMLSMFGQYGREFEELTELQQATFIDDLDKLVNGIIHEVLNEALQAKEKEVIERVEKKVIGKDNPESIDNPRVQFYSGTYEQDVVDIRNDLRDEQRQALQSLKGEKE